MIRTSSSVYSIGRILSNTGYVSKWSVRLIFFSIYSYVYLWFFLVISFSNAFPFSTFIAYTTKDKFDMVSHWEFLLFQSGPWAKGNQTPCLGIFQNVEVNIEFQDGSSLLFNMLFTHTHVLRLTSWK